MRYAYLNPIQGELAGEGRIRISGGIVSLAALEEKLAVLKSSAQVASEGCATDRRVLPMRLETLSRRVDESF
jgi:hypothetical protein